MLGFTRNVSPKNSAKEKKSAKQQFLEELPAVIAFSAAVGFSIIAYVLGYFGNRADFFFQKVLFSVWAVAALICGLNAGYRNPNEKRFWATIDVIWIFTAVLSLGSLLNPVEDRVLKGVVQSSDSLADASQRIIQNEIAFAVKTVCATKGAVMHCRDWKALQAGANKGEVTPTALLGRLQRDLPKLQQQPVSDKYRQVIEENLKSMGEAIDEGRKARSALENVSIWWPYAKLLALVIALGLRAGKTGADWANSKPKKPKTFVYRAVGFGPASTPPPNDLKR